MKMGWAWAQPIFNGYVKSAATGIDATAARIHVVTPAGVYVVTAAAGAGRFFTALFLGFGGLNAFIFSHISTSGKGKVIGVVGRRQADASSRSKSVLDNCTP